MHLHACRALLFDALTDVHVLQNSMDPPPRIHGAKDPYRHYGSFPSSNAWHPPLVYDPKVDAIKIIDHPDKPREYELVPAGLVDDDIWKRNLRVHAEPPDYRPEKEYVQKLESDIYLDETHYIVRPRGSRPLTYKEIVTHFRIDELYKESFTYQQEWYPPSPPSEPDPKRARTGEQAQGEQLQRCMAVQKMTSGKSPWLPALIYGRQGRDYLVKFDSIQNDYMEHRIDPDNLKLCEVLPEIDADNPFDENLLGRTVMVAEKNCTRYEHSHWKEGRIVGGKKVRNGTVYEVRKNNGPGNGGALYGLDQVMLLSLPSV